MYVKLRIELGNVLNSFDTSTAAKSAALAFQESPVAQILIRYRQIVVVNKAMERLFEFPRNEIEGRSVKRLFPSQADFTHIGEKCEYHMRNSQDTYYEDERFMQTNAKEVFLVRARGITLSPDDPFRLMVWSFERTGPKQYRSVRLTPREREVANLIVNGHTSREIGTKLGISHRTVEVHRAKLMKKFHVHNTAELVSEILVAV